MRPALYLKRVEALRLLQVVGTDLLRQANAPPLVVAQVDEDACWCGSEQLEAALELRAAVAARASKHIAGDADTVDACEDVLLRCDVTLDEDDMLHVSVDAAVYLDLKGLYVLGQRHRQPRLCRHLRAE